MHTRTHTHSGVQTCPHILSLKHKDTHFEGALASYFSKIKHKPKCTYLLILILLIMNYF